MDQPYRNRSKIIAPQHMIKDVTDLLNEEFDKQYAKNSNV
jgi:hypothetical protein